MENQILKQNGRGSRGDFVQISEKDAAGSRVSRLHKSLRGKGSSLSEFFSYLRASYLNSLPEAAGLKRQAENAGIKWPEPLAEKKIYKEVMKEFELDTSSWGSFEFHLIYRLKGRGGLGILLEEGKITKKEATEAAAMLARGGCRYDLSVLPLNFLLPHEAIAKYIPAENYWEARQPDPYGFDTPTAKITAEIDGKKMCNCLGF